MIPLPCVINSFTTFDSIMVSDISVQSSRLTHRGSSTNLHPGNIMLQTYTNTRYCICRYTDRLKQTDSLYLWLIEVLWRNHKTWLSVCVAYEAWSDKPQVDFTLATADNLPAKHSRLLEENSKWTICLQIVHLLLGNCPMSLDACRQSYIYTYLPTQSNSLCFT